MPNINEKAANFCLVDANEKKHCLKDLIGKWVVLYFYPKDNTSGCTKEAVGFSEKIKEFKELNCEIVGISPDTPKKHKNFIEKYGLKVLLLSDVEHTVIEQYGAWGKKKMYGREYFGTIRSTYLIDTNGIITAVWNKVKVKDHIEDVLQKLTENI